METEKPVHNEMEMRKQEINQRYDRKIERIFFPAMAGAVLGLSLLTGGLIKTINDAVKTDYSTTSVHIKHNNIRSARSYLMKLKKDLTFSNLEFKPNPENVNPYFEKVFGNLESRTKHLDEAIELASSDLSELDKNPICIAEQRNEIYSMISVLGGAGLTVLGLIGGMGYQMASDSKRYKELKKLEMKEQ